jgi:hypothetical protein
MFIPCTERYRAPFNRWPFTPYPQGHRIFLALFMFFPFRYAGPDTTVGTGAIFPETCKVARLCHSAKWQPCLFMFFLSKRRRDYSSPPPLFLNSVAVVSSAFFLFISPFVFGLASCVLSLFYLCPSSRPPAATAVFFTRSLRNQC